MRSSRTLLEAVQSETAFYKQQLPTKTFAKKLQKLIQRGSNKRRTTFNEHIAVTYYHEQIISQYKLKKYKQTLSESLTCNFKAGRYKILPHLIIKKNIFLMLQNSYTTQKKCSPTKFTAVTKILQKKRTRQTTLKTEASNLQLTNLLTFSFPAMSMQKNLKTRKHLSHSFMLKAILQPKIYTRRKLMDSKG